MSEDLQRPLAEHSAAASGEPPADPYRLLGRYAPWALDGYRKMREAALREPAEGGVLPRKDKDLILVAMHIAEKNRWGAATYAAAAIRDGATLAQVAEIVAMTMMTNGQVGYQTAGQYALAAAVEAAGERHDG